MASKTRKSATPASQTGRPSSPLSPTRHSRLQEKAELQNLNDRLAAYIDRVRYLETENSRLSREVQTTQETVTREVQNIKAMYDHELMDARKLLDETHKEKAKLEIDTKRLWDENEELKAALAKKAKDLILAENSVRILETKSNDFQLKYNQAQADAKKAQAELRDMEKERDKLKKQLDELRKQLEDESLGRVDVENANQTLREEMAFKDQIYQQQLTETRTKRQIEITEIDGRLAEQYEAKLQHALHDLRDQYETQMANNRQEIEMLYENKIKNLESAAHRNTGAAAAAIDELRQTRTRIDTLSGRIADLESQNAMLSTRARDLEKQLENERMRHAEDLGMLENELARLRDEMAVQLQEYQDLMDIKVSLDLEIATYRKLLESEEDRLHLTPTGEVNTSVRSSSIQRRGTPSRGGAKRKRTLLEESQEQSVSDYSVTNSCKGDVEIAAADGEGQFVKLHNKSNKEVPVGSWQVVRKAGDSETTYKFHRAIKIEANGYVTVWSANLGKEHEPPTNLVMKSQKWFVADNMTTTLIDNNGEEMAKYFYLSDYKMLMGSPIPYSQLGYKNLEDFISSIPSLTTSCLNGQIFVDAKITEKSSHISNFVDRQKSSKKKRPSPKQTYKKFSSAPPRWRPKTNNNWKNPFETSPRFAAVAHTQMVSSRLHPDRKFVQMDRREETASTSPVENFREMSDTLSQQAKRRLSQKMVNLNFQDIPLVQETSKITENNDTQLDENAFLRTGNHLMDLRTFASQNNLGEPIIKTKVQSQKNSRNRPSYYCRIQLDDVSGSSYPLDIHEEEIAKQEAAKKLLDTLQEKWRLKNRRNVIISDDVDILQRIPSMVRVHQCGVWNREIEETYLKQYKEQLPSNWVEIVDTLPYIVILRIHDQFVLNYCDPKEKRNGSNVPSKNVSVQPNPVKFDEDELFVAEITCITSAAEVWCCQRDTPVWHSFCKMVYELEKYYNSNGAYEKAATIQIGGYYVALHDQMWCRVRVFEVNNDDIHCFCIDFGDEWVIKKDHLFNLNKAFAEEHAQAFVCRLAGVEELYEASKTSERLQSFLGKVVQVQVESHLETSVDRNNPAVPVVLYDEAGSPINEQIITLMSMEMALPTLTINTPTEVHVTHALSDGTVYVQLRTKGFEHLMSLIEKAGQNIIDEKISIQPVAVSKSENDRMYLIQYGENKSWQRVQIIDWSPYNEKFAQILFVDTGNTAVVTVKDISFYALDEISDVISKFPTQGYLVRLPLKHVPSNFEEKIYELIPPDEAVLVKSLRIDDDYVPIVEFFKRSESDNVLFSVNMTLTDQLKQNGDDANNTCGGKSQSKKLQILMSLNQFEDMLKNVPSTGLLPCPKIPEVGHYFDVKIP